MTVYSILLIIIASAIIAFSKLNKRLLRKDARDEAVLMENFIVDLWKKNAGRIVLNENSLLEVEGQELVFSEGTLLYGTRTIFTDTHISMVERAVRMNFVEIIIYYGNGHEKIIIL